MTDLERFIETYKTVGIELKPGVDEHGNQALFLGGYYNDTDQSKFDGYSGFYSLILFTSEGKFISQGFWE